MNNKTKSTHKLHIGDHIVYPSHGVGKIVAIDKEMIADVNVELYSIFFEKDKMTLRVPTKRAEDAGLRPVVSEAIVEKAIAKLKTRSRAKRTMWSRRAQEYEQKINSGDLLSIAEVVRDLYHQRDENREQSYSEQQVYNQALTRMVNELAIVLDTTKEDIKTELENTMYACYQHKDKTTPAVS